MSKHNENLKALSIYLDMNGDDIHKIMGKPYSRSQCNAWLRSENSERHATGAKRFRNMTSDDFAAFCSRLVDSMPGDPSFNGRSRAIDILQKNGMPYLLLSPTFDDDGELEFPDMQMMTMSNISSTRITKDVLVSAFSTGFDQLYETCAMLDDELGEMREAVQPDNSQLVVEQHDPGQNRWLCRCDCGNEIAVSQADLQSGAVTSCGQCGH